MSTVALTRGEMSRFFLRAADDCLLAVDRWVKRAFGMLLVAQWVGTVCGRVLMCDARF